MALSLNFSGIRSHALQAYIGGQQAKPKQRAGATELPSPMALVLANIEWRSLMRERASWSGLRRCESGIKKKTISAEK
ncbi:hypothetical protein [Kamptonema formosum]|uniref:hypothetical protein n=1 Tax=Kamptonema formosum TaxID=331992 RepID=UPI0003496E4C|nr:hypothetical protein [Oscillatoria sp. PCC 10802]